MDSAAANERVRVFLLTAKSAFLRDAATLPKRLTSWTFVVWVLSPFCLWCGLLLWFQVPFSGWHASVSAGDLTRILYVWTLAAGMWIAGALALGRYRHASIVFLAIGVLTAVRICLPPLIPTTEHRTSDWPPTRPVD